MPPFRKSGGDGGYVVIGNTCGSLPAPGLQAGIFPIPPEWGNWGS